MHLLEKVLAYRVGEGVPENGNGIQGAGEGFFLNRKNDAPSSNAPGVEYGPAFVGM